MQRYAIYAVMFLGIGCAVPQKVTPVMVVRNKPITAKHRCNNQRWASIQPLIKAYSRTPPTSMEGEELRQDLTCYAQSFMEWMEIYDAAVNNNDQVLKQRALNKLQKLAKSLSEWEELYPVAVKEKDAILRRKVVQNIFLNVEGLKDLKRIYVLAPETSAMKIRAVQRLIYKAETCEDWRSLSEIALSYSVYSVLEYVAKKMIIAKRCCYKKGFADVPDGRSYLPIDTLECRRSYSP